MNNCWNKNRSRKKQIILYLNDDEKFIFNEETKLSGMTNRAAFLRQLIVFGVLRNIDSLQICSFKKFYFFNICIAIIPIFYF